MNRGICQSIVARVYLYASQKYSAAASRAGKVIFHLLKCGNVLYRR
ncbi:hypothetical protein HMPREF0201_01781 [Cedecea davisae DSM 4568]|uniref:Uncharacterized protein n=1 Tax=Cedecea davisae DSM 4568 TaxID=566551 RepID=S3JCA6_9ENTR|nr:hypothetical protein HMPREF0201_01781 [Cedecea davisae DSM 4568]